MERFKSWPRWVRYGALSAIPSFALALIGMSSEGIVEVGLFFTYGSIAPALLMPEIIQEASWELGIFASLSINLIWISIFWFLFGAFLGKVINRPRLAIFLWLFVQIFGGLVIWWFTWFSI